MRVIRITTNYPAYLEQFYQNFPELSRKSYSEQYEALMADCYGWADFWTHALRKFGYELWEPVGNAKPMQETWAHEQNVTYTQHSWLQEIIIAQAKYFSPDIVLVNDHVRYPAEFFRRLRHECSSIRCVIGWCGAPYPDNTVFREYDLVLSNIPSLVAQFQKQGHTSEYFPHAFEPRILDKIVPELSPPIPFTFLGSVFKNAGFHNQREHILRELARNTELQIWSDIPHINQKQMLRLQRDQKIFDLVHLASNFKGLKPLLSAIPKIRDFVSMTQRPTWAYDVDINMAVRSHPPLFGIAMYQHLRDSQVTLNNHIDISSDFASNVRLFEATGVGTCVLTDWRPNLGEFFEPEVEMVTYRCAEEAAEKVRYLLTHEKIRNNIAKAGQKRTLSNHTYEIRAHQLDQLIQKTLARCA